jgi:hypothetical protein
MQDDPFARAVQRAEASEEAQKASKRERQRETWSSASRTAFRTHASVFVAVNLLLVAIWATTTPGYPWFLWPLLGWGIGLVAHFAAVKDSLRPPRGAVPSVYPAPAPAAAPSPAPAHAAAPVAAAPLAPSTTDELTRLAELHRSGSLNDDEFTAAKAKLLG